MTFSSLLLLLAVVLATAPAWVLSRNVSTTPPLAAQRPTSTSPPAALHCAREDPMHRGYAACARLHEETQAGNVRLGAPSVTPGYDGWDDWWWG
jgi:hypothetical protein